MGLFTTSASNEAENQAWLENLRVNNPQAYSAYIKYRDSTTLLQNLSNESLGRTSERALINKAFQIAQSRGDRASPLMSIDDARKLITKYKEADKSIVQTQFPDVWKYSQEHGERTGGLGQGGDVLVASVALPVAAAYLAPAAGAGTAGTAGTTAGTGAATGTAAGTGAAAGTTAGTTTGTVAGTGAGYSGLTDAAVSTGVAGGLESGSGSSAGATAGTTAGTGVSGGGFFDSLGNWISSPTGQGLLNLDAGYLQGEQNQQAANTYAQAQLEAARIAAEEARFRPIGVTTRFGQSQFGYDDKGRLTSAGYTLSPELKAQQDALMGAITGNQGMLQPQNRSIAGARANGGPVAGGQTYLVGENGPELFTAPSSGGIIPNQIGNAMANQGMVYAGGSPGFYSGGQHQTGSVTTPARNPNWIGAPEMAPNNQPIPRFGVQQQEQQSGLLGQAVGAQQITAPLSQGAQSLFNLGQGYLATSPQEQAARYMQEQQALLSPSRERGLAQLQNQMYQQGRIGLATGATSTMGAANPELEAFYNAQRQQDLALAAQATQGGQQYAQFGAGLLGTGGEMLRGMYGTQTAAYQPYQTALGLTQQIEGLGQNAMDIGVNLGAKGAAAGTNVGSFLQGGAERAGQVQLPANQYNPWVGLLQGAANWY